MHIRVWSPLPPSPSGIADYVAEQLTALSGGARVTAVVEEPGAVRSPPAGVGLSSPAAVPDADLDLYELGNSPAHAYVYRAALLRPGVVVLHEWSLHHLVLKETVERGDVSSYLREMRRAHGEVGTFVGRQVARALGGDLFPALFPLNDRVLESALAIVGLTRFVASRAARRLPGHPVLHLPHHVTLPFDPLPSRLEARRALGLPDDALLVTAPGLATATKRLDVAIRVLRTLREEFPSLTLVVAGEVDPRLPLAAWLKEAGLEDRAVVTGRLELPDFVRHLVAADVVLCLRFPSHGEISGALLRALGVGRPALVTGGTPAADEFPEGVVIPVDPGPREDAELRAFLARLLADRDFRESVGRVARKHVLAAHSLAGEAQALLVFLGEVLGRKGELERALDRDRIPEGTLLGYLMEEVRWGARDLGLPGVQLGLEPLLLELTRGKA
jgi:glycosyltransferase involved in cell wall biosynthesis